MRLLQFKDKGGECHVGLVGDSGTVRAVEGLASVYELAMSAIAHKRPITSEIQEYALSGEVDYDALEHECRLLPPIVHPEPARFWVTGTGLTHIGSAQARDKMHELTNDDGHDEMTDSMKIFKMGLEGGKPPAGKLGVQPEWFYKGNGTCVLGSGQALSLPAFALSGGEEAEIVGLYVIGPNGDPFRVGYAIGNEFSDQVTESMNYLYLAHSKLRQCAIGPEILIGELPNDVRGVTRVYHNSEVKWEGSFISGEDNMSHSIRNLEHYHFRYDMFRRPGDVHAYFLGASSLSCADGVSVEAGDRFEIDVPTFGRPLRNAMQSAPEPSFKVHVL